MTLELTPLSLAITGVGAMTPVGHTAPETCAAIRAGISGFSDHPFFDTETPDPGWDVEEPLTAAMVSVCDPQVEGPNRLVELGVAALRELLQTTHLRRSDLESTALLLALPEADDVVSQWALPAMFASALCKRAGLPVPSVVSVDQSGHLGVFNLLRTADAILAARQCTRCALLAVDTFHDEGRLDLLDSKFRLRSDRSVDGYLPGEAAVALMLEQPRPGALATIETVAVADEPHPFSSELSSTGRGLHEVLAGLIDRHGVQAPWIVCDLNGESYRACEWGLMLTRLAPRLDTMRRLDHPADCVGDTGAATGGILLAHVTRAFVRDYAPSSKALLFASNDGALRFAVAVARPTL